MSARLFEAIPSEYQAIARRYAATWRQLGWSDNQIDSALQWGLAYQGDPEGLAGDFQAFLTTRLGIDASDAALATNVSEEMQTAINTGKMDLSAPARDDTDILIDDIRKFMREHPNEYNSDKAMQAAYLDLIGKQLGEEVPAREPIPAAAQRLAEIRQICRDDPHAYNSNKALQAEGLALIEASLQPQSNEPAQSALSQGATTNVQSSEA